jgi:hypothetical protein
VLIRFVPVLARRWRILRPDIKAQRLPVDPPGVEVKARTELQSSGRDAASFPVRSRRDPIAG